MLLQTSSRMDINPLVNALWAQQFSNKSTQLSTFALAKYPAKALLCVALPNSLISAVGCWICPFVICAPSQVLQIELLPPISPLHAFTPLPQLNEWSTIYSPYFDFGYMICFGQWQVYESHSMPVPSLSLKRPHMFCSLSCTSAITLGRT